MDVCCGFLLDVLGTFAHGFGRPKRIWTNHEGLLNDLGPLRRSDYDASRSKYGLLLDPNTVPATDKIDVMWWPKINLGKIFE